MDETNATLRERALPGRPEAEPPLPTQREAHAVPGFFAPARDTRTLPWRRRYRRPILTLAAALVGAAGLFAWRDATSALLFLACAAVAFLLVPGVARLALRLGAVSLPGGRAVHDVPIPLVGGAALFIPVAGTLLVMGLLGDTKAWGMLVGGTIVFACGLVDDVRGASARTKILMQLLAGGALLLAGFELRGFGIPGVGVLGVGSATLGAALLLFWIVLATNALNLSDGLDGLATSLAVLGMGVVVAGGLTNLLPIALAGACLGFLYYNLPTARIFLGDAGSMLLGFLLAALVLQLPADANVPLGIAALAYPLGDVILSVSRRLARGKPLFAPDRSHVHHKALEEFGSPLRALLAVLLFASVQATLLVVWRGLPSLLVCAAMWFVLSAVLVRNGRDHTSSVFSQRRLMRRLHVTHGYVSATLQLAESREDVELVLLHMIEASDVCTVSIDGLQLVSRRGVDGCRGPEGCVGDCKQHRLALLGRSCTWSAVPSPQGAAIEEERETVLAGLLRQAADRLQSMPASPPAVAAATRAADPRAHEVGRAGTQLPAQAAPVPAPAAAPVSRPTPSGPMQGSSHA